MKQTMVQTTISLLVVLFMSVGVQASFNVPTVYRISGTVKSLSHHSMWVAVNDSCQLYSGSSVRTGTNSKALIVFGDDTIASLESDTLITLSLKKETPLTQVPVQCVEIDILKGTALLRRSKESFENPFTVSTDTNVGVIRTRQNSESTLVTVDIREHTEQWAAGAGKIHVISKNPHSGSVSLNEFQYISTNTTTPLSRNQRVNIVSPSLEHSILKQLCECLENLNSVRKTLCQKNDDTIKGKSYTLASSKIIEKARASIERLRRFKKHDTLKIAVLFLGERIVHSMESIHSIMERTCEKRARNLLSTPTLPPRTESFRSENNERSLLERLKVLSDKVRDLRKEMKEIVQNESPEIASKKLKRVDTQLKLAARQTEITQKNTNSQSVVSMAHSITRTITALRTNMFFYKKTKTP